MAEGRKDRTADVALGGGSAVDEGSLRFPFGAAFSAIRAIEIGGNDGRGLAIRDLLPDGAGRFWIVADSPPALRIYSQEGRCLRRLETRSSYVHVPAGLTALHGRWIAVLDGKLPAIVILDERGRPVRRFALPELDRPLQLCNLGDRLLAVAGTGWGRARRRMVHLYSLAGEYRESLFGEPHDGRRPYVAAAGSRLYLGHGDSFSVYDVEARSVLSFPRHGQAVSERGTGAPERAADEVLAGLFATRCGALLAVYGTGPGDSFSYDLFGLDGTPLAVGLRMPERVVGVEGPLFYSVRRGDSGPTLRVWKLRSWDEDEAEGGGKTRD